MSLRYVAGFSGNITRPSKTRSFVEHVVADLTGRTGLAGEVYDVIDLGPSLGTARSLGDLDGAATDILERILAADALVIGSPTYKGSYPGLFKHVFDLIDPAALRGKPVIITATGGGDRHSLVVEHQLRPLFAFFEAFVVPTAIYASGRDFDELGQPSPAIVERARQAVSEAARLIGFETRTAGLAAE